MDGFRVCVISARSPSGLMEKYYAVRRAVFVDEQNVDISIEFDEYEDAPGTVHLVVLSETGECAGAGRLTDYSVHAGLKTAKIGRVCVLKNYRGIGLGEVIVEKLIQMAREGGYEKIILHSQVYISRLYEKFGFVKQGEIFKEANIDHIEMSMRL